MTIYEVTANILKNGSFLGQDMLGVEANTQEEAEKVAKLKIERIPGYKARIVKCRIYKPAKR